MRSPAFILSSVLTCRVAGAALTHTNKQNGTTTMEIGIFTQGYVRTDSNPQQRIADVIELARVADEEGLASFGMSEQHFKFPTNSTGPIAAIMAAIAQCTSRIQITPGAVILPFHHPLNVAESWAAVDIISNGRLYFGYGKGNTPLTADTYNVPVSETDARTEECLEVLLKAWGTERFSHQGKYFQIPELAVCPRPVQQPLPPMAYAGASLQAAELAGKKKMGFMTASVASYLEEVEGILRAYEAAWETGTPMQGTRPFKFSSLLVHGHVARDMKDIREQVSDGVVNYVNRVIHYKRVFAERLGKPNPTYGQEWVDNFDYVMENTPCVFGTPDEAIRRLQRIKKAGFDRVDITLDYAKQEDLIECVRLLGREVAPALREEN
ncbi:MULTISPECIES: LLM class flavin-dependent oxidoreductase [unclassified Bradyrhizobium]|jgi:alkanesulfonate monooxygenase SsuD/methylene tetrahydromethanopterin reductase-like flavin-dependent oxidoreductase (luciferase family)|uniref:LLM class flavin-dependent oxidoreductase n=1 Tax=unclassified Bradyrhizobium TaxID=2631580 RepID=UPI0006882B8B|nr:MULTISPECIES: LLM class flavin-dependent oxidoreductase [unclassified Bradyrhizobium]MBK5652005.1 LLM class flavin-dependent oxidoreductase [Rhizobium sp.]